MVFYFFSCTWFVYGYESWKGVMEEIMFMKVERGLWKEYIEEWVLCWCAPKVRYGSSELSYSLSIVKVQLGGLYYWGKEKDNAWIVTNTIKHWYKLPRTVVTLFGIKRVWRVIEICCSHIKGLWETPLKYQNNLIDS